MSILICYDGSPSARNAIVQAAAARLHGRVSILNVWERPLDVIPDSFGCAESGEGPSSKRLLEASHRRALELANEGRLLAEAHGLYAVAMTAPDRSSVWETILRVADSEFASMIVVGSHPRGTPGPTLASVSAAVLEHSSRPVLMIPMAVESEIQEPVGAASAY